MLKKIAKYAGIMLFNLFLIECILRFTGFLLLFQMQSSNGQVSLKNQPIVMILGESTSAPNGEISWPEQLQKNLHSTHPTQLINLATPGTNSNFILNRLPDDLETYRPNVIISMLGINDEEGNWFFDAGLVNKGNFLYDLKIFKFARMLKAILRERFTTENTPLAQNAEIIPSLYRDMIQQNKYDDAAPAIEDFLKGKDKGFRDRFYINLIYLLSAELAKKSVNNAYEIENKFHLFDNTKDLLYQSEFLALEMINRYSQPASSEKAEVCKYIIKSFMSDPGFTPGLTLMRSLQQCAVGSEIGYEPFSRKFFPNISKKEENGDMTRANYQSLYNYVNKHNVCWIVIQYPMRDIRNRLEYFSAEQQKNKLLQFVSLKEVFETALQKHKFEEIFLDRFGSDFGHTTQLGHKIIADTVGPFVVSALKSKNCSRY